MPTTGKARDVWIDVYIDSITPLAFRVEPSPDNNPPLLMNPNGAIEFSNNHHNGFQVHFVLKGDTHGYYFPPNDKKQHAIWSKLGTECPNRIQVTDVFQPVSIPQPPKPNDKERRELIALNPNPKPAQGTFQYNLRVTNNEGVNYIDLDPGGDNQNGPVTRYDWSTAFVFVSGAVVGSLATLGTQALMQG